MPDNVSRRILSEQTLNLLATLVLIGFLVATFLATPIGWGLKAEADAMDYRIPYVKALATWNSPSIFPVWTWSTIDNYPPFPELLMAICLSLGLPLRLVPALGVALSAAAGAVFARSLGRKDLAVLAAAFGLATYAVQIQSVILLTDLISAAFALLGITLLRLSLIRQQNTRIQSFGWLFLSLAWVSKYWLWPWLAVASFWLFLEHWFKTRSARKRLLTFCLALCSLIPVALWCWHNFRLTGNPILPVLGHVIPSSELSLADGQRVEGYWTAYGRPKNILNFFLTPIYLWLSHEPYDYPAGITWPLVMILGIWGLFRYPIERSTKFFWIGMVSWSYLFWFLSAQQTRFLNAALVMTGWFAALGAVTAIRQKNSLTKLPLVLAFTVALISGFQGLKYQARHLAALIAPRNEFFHSKAFADQNESLMPIIQKTLSQPALSGKNILGVLDRTGDLAFLDSPFVYVMPHPYVSSIPAPAHFLYGRCEHSFPKSDLLAESPNRTWCFWKNSQAVKR